MRYANGAKCRQINTNSLLRNGSEVYCKKSTTKIISTIAKLLNGWLVAGGWCMSCLRSANRQPETRLHTETKNKKRKCLFAFSIICNYTWLLRQGGPWHETHNDFNSDESEFNLRNAVCTNSSRIYSMNASAICVKCCAKKSRHQVTSRTSWTSIISVGFNMWTQSATTAKRQPKNCHEMEINLSYFRTNFNEFWHGSHRCSRLPLAHANSGREIEGTQTGASARVSGVRIFRK